MIAAIDRVAWALPGVITAGGFSAGVAPATDADAPIGLYDSGVGGLSVLSAVARHLPGERFIYIADQAHVPYGGRPLEEIRGFAGSMARYLFDRGCKSAVMACNISSATALEEVEAGVGPEHVLGVIRPGAKAAVAATQTGRIGVLATAGTVASGAYPAAIAALDDRVVVHQVACPQFVPLVEADRTASEEAHLASKAYLAPLIEAGVDIVILGCTHYPFLTDTLRNACQDRLQFVDPSEETAAALSATLRAAGRVRLGDPGPHQLLTTGDPAVFEAQLPRFAPGIPAEVAHLAWHQPDADYPPIY